MTWASSWLRQTLPHLGIMAICEVSCVLCEGESDVVGVVAPLGGMAQVIFHGVQVVEVGVQVRVHKEGEKEEDGEVQVEVEKEVEENQGEPHIMDGMRMG